MFQQFLLRLWVLQLRRRDRYPQCICSCSLFSSWTRFLTCPLWYYDRCFVRWCRKLWSPRSCISSTVVDIPFCSAEAEPHGPRLFSGSLRFRSCRSFFGGRCPCCAGRADSRVPPWRRPRFFFCRQAQMLGIMAGMAQKNSYAATQLCLAGLAGDDTARALFPDNVLDVHDLDFLGDDFRNYFRMQYSWFDSGHMYCVSHGLRYFLRRST